MSRSRWWCSSRRGSRIGAYDTVGFRITRIAFLLIMALLILDACSREPLGVPLKGDPPFSQSSGPSSLMADSSSIPNGPGQVFITAPDTAKASAPPREAEHPETVLTCLSEAYRARAVDLLASCLAPDFRFYPGHYATEQMPQPTDASWDRNQEVAMHINMFNPSYKTGTVFRGADVISASFTLVAKEPCGDPIGDRWKLTCNAIVTIYNTHTSPRPFAMTQEGVSYFLVEPDSRNVGRWLIEAWWESVGQRHLLYRP